MSLYDYFEHFDQLTGKDDIAALNTLKKPTIFHQAGEDSSAAILITVLQHGTEPCGFRAMLREIAKHPTYPHDVYWLVANPKSAQQVPYFFERLAPGGQNYNRIWVEDPATPDEHIAAELYAFLSGLPLRGMIDLHSFAARHTAPHCFISTADPRTVAIMKRLVPYIFVHRSVTGTLEERMAEHCVSAVIECGTNDTAEADGFAYRIIQKFLIEMDYREGRNPVIAQGMAENSLNVKVKPDVKVGWGRRRDPTQDLTLRHDFDSLNHREQPAGTLIGWADSLDPLFAHYRGEAVDITQVFHLEGEAIYLKRAKVPNLMAIQEYIAKESGWYFFDQVPLE